jgi:murein DD-endopeptidase MepM/ murein hydrolase activator NlpD
VGVILFSHIGGATAEDTGERALPLPALAAGTGAAPEQQEPGERLAALAPEPEPAASPRPETTTSPHAVPAPDRTEEVEVRPGDNLIQVFQRADAPLATLYDIIADREHKRELARLRPGQVCAFQLDADGRLLALHWDRGRRDGLAYERRGQEWTQRPLPPKAEPEPVVSAPSAEEAAELAAAPEPAAEPRVISTTVRNGDSLSSIFSRLGLQRTDLHRLLGDRAAKHRFSRLHPGQDMDIATDGNGKVTEIQWQVDEELRVAARYTAEGIVLAEETIPLERRVAAVSGTVRSSLFEAGQEAGLSSKVIMEMVEVLAWDIDFVLDIRRGDAFTLFHEEFYDEAGGKVKDGAILGVMFTNQGREVTALRYTTPDGHTDYYDPEGRSMRKAFLRSPVKFARISSGFSLARMHPILHRVRAHKGVDYAAPTGTPIRATGDAKVVFRGTKGGYGKTVVLQHGGSYTTLYAHMSRYAKGTRPGQRVRQGQVIGYIGETGLATGPHLHYEFRIDGRHRDPLRVELPKAEPLPERYLDDFQRKTGPILARLKLSQPTQVALSEQ